MIRILQQRLIESGTFPCLYKPFIVDPKQLRENILEKGGSVEEMEMYVNFRGAEPTIEPLLKGRGLN